ncbi:MAG: PDZ domain-containing protein [Phycisphaerales bacterium]|nr:PDZ domain-containing protein [Phycisphaerales bacterium]
MLKRTGLAIAVMMVLAGGALAEEGGTATPLTAAQKLEKAASVAKATDKSLVIVEYTLQYDKGEAPRAAEVIQEERPLEVPGFLIEGNKVVTDSAQIHPRFIKGIAVRRYGSAAKSEPRVAAKVWGYPKEQWSVILQMDGELAGATAVKFEGGGGNKDAASSVVNLTGVDGDWAVRVTSAGGELTLVRGKQQIVTENRGLVVDATGAGVGILPSFGPVMADGSWKGDPLKWPMISAEEMAKTLADLETKANRGIVRVMLNFRSPRNVGPERFRSPESAATVQYRLGVMVDDRTILVLSEMKPPVTARLERIKVLGTTGEDGVEAKFKGSLSDYGAFVAELEKPVTGAGMAMSKAKMEDLAWRALPTLDLFLQGEKRVCYAQPMRIDGFQLGWRRHLYPEVSESRSSGGKGLFVFDREGALMALPVTMRRKASMEERYSGRNQPLTTAMTQLAEAIADLPANCDKDNQPLSEEQENRIAWVGIEMQGLNAELARANNVSDQTNDGETGALITYVYPDSPAGKAGVEAGWILLRIEAEGQPKPIEVHVDPDPMADRGFPWDQLDRAQESNFDDIFRYYSPWPRANSGVVRTVTELGFGKHYTAEFFHDAKVDKKTFTVVEGPAYFDNAPKYKDAKLGLTVKDLTYEVQRYMQKKTDDPGVIVGKIELGSRASKAGIKPFEVITHVNDQPVMNVKDFEKLMAGQDEVRLSVKRMTKGRIVKVKLAEAGATQPAMPSAE